MSGPNYKEFVDADYTRFRSSLLRTKGGQRQREFLEATRNNTDFLELVRGHTETDGSEEPPLCLDRMTENEFKDPPRSTEVDLYKAWTKLTPRMACRTTFWASVTCRHIENGRINAVYLATNGGTLPGGAERIDKVLQADEAEAAKPIDDCVRAILRRLGGLPEARGNRDVYVGCPLARAWWREHLVAEISQGNEDLADQVREVTRINLSYWEELVTLVVSRNSILGSHVLRNAFILSLTNLLERESRTPLRIAKELRRACRTIGVIQASHEMSVLEGDEIQTLMDDIVKAHHDEALTRQSDHEPSLKAGSDK